MIIFHEYFSHGISLETIDTVNTLKSLKQSLNDTSYVFLIPRTISAPSRRYSSWRNTHTTPTVPPVATYLQPPTTTLPCLIDKPYGRTEWQDWTDNEKLGTSSTEWGVGGLLGEMNRRWLIYEEFQFLPMRCNEAVETLHEKSQQLSEHLLFFICFRFFVFSV